jgi:ketosteroid isomerase-like protein
MTTISTTTTPEVNAATVTTIYEAFGRGDVPAIIERLAPDVHWNVMEPPTSGQEAGVPWLVARRGRDEVPGFFSALDRGLVFHDFRVERLHAAGDTVIAELRMDIESTRTGDRVTASDLHLWTFDLDGQVVDYHQHSDTAGHIALAGIGPAANAATVGDLYRRFGDGDVPGILERISPDATWDVYPAPNAGQDAGVPWLQARRGREEIAGFFATLVEAIEIDTFVPHDIVAEGNRVVSEITLGATIRATGARIEDEVFHVWTFDDDGRPLSFRHIADTAKHIAAAGLS